MNTEIKDQIKRDIANWAEDRTLEAIEVGLNELKEIYIAKLKYEIDKCHSKLNALNQEQRDTEVVLEEVNKKFKEIAV